MKSIAVAVVLTAAMGSVVVLAGRDVPVVRHEAVYLADATTRPTTRPAQAINSVCPVHGQHEADPAITATHNGKTYAFCCTDGRARFSENPEQYAKPAN